MSVKKAGKVWTFRIDAGIDDRTWETKTNLSKWL